MQSYLQKHAYGDSLIKEPPNEGLQIMIVIPSYHETELLNSIYSILECDKPNGVVEILPILNYPESSNADVVKFHSSQYEVIQKLSEDQSSDHFQIHAIEPCSLPDKIAGVGFARKLGMDEAVRRFELLNKNGIILNFDADCICKREYLTEVMDYMNKHESIQALSIGFQHRWDHLELAEQEAIKLYELHLRCYIGWQKAYGYPFAFQTLGSCFAVWSKAYQAQGGMNRRKAGEDFYFLHKYSILGLLGELNKALVFPSGRISNRVPFGTGKSVNDIVHSKIQFKTYNPQAIHAFCQCMVGVRKSYDLFKKGRAFETIEMPNSLKTFLTDNLFAQALESAMSNSSTANAFEKRISRWFDPFRLMKYLHFARESEFPDIEVMESAKKLVGLYHLNMHQFEDTKESLLNKLISISF